MEKRWTTGSLHAFTELLEAESLACKKAHMYGLMLTDLAQADRIRALAERHARRFKDLMEFMEKPLGGGQ